MKPKAWVLLLVAPVVATLLIVFVVPRAYSSRLHVLEPHLKPFTPLSEIQQVAVEHEIPLETGPSRDPPEVYANFAVQLDGVNRLKTLYLTFREGKLWSAVIMGRDGELERQFFCIKPK
jgi:hypothetical protein